MIKIPVIKNHNRNFSLTQMNHPLDQDVDQLTGTSSFSLHDLTATTLIYRPFQPMLR